MRSLFDTPAGCHCRGIGVTVDNGLFKFCTCPDGAREQAHDKGGYGPSIGRPASEVVAELQSRLKEKSLAH